MNDYEVAVVGAGPAGSATALHLARAGLSVVLLDKAKFPRSKPCGGGVTGRAFNEAPIDLSPVVEHEVNRVRFSFRRSGNFVHTHDKTLAYMTQRHRLDAFLAEQAATAGADFIDDCGLISLSSDPTGVTVHTRGPKLRARVVVGADGANGIVGRSVSLNPVGDRQVALEANFPYDEEQIPAHWDGSIGLELGSVRGGYSWSFPKNDHFNVGSGGWQSEGVHLRGILADLRKQYDLDGTPMLNLRGQHLPLRAEGAPIVKGPVLLVGDAAGLVDPMSGEGIGSAFVSARLAAETIQRFLDGSVPDLLGYELAVDREVMPEVLSARVLRNAYDFSPRFSYLALRRCRPFRTLLCSLMTGEISYVDFVRQLGPAAIVLRWVAARGQAQHSSA